MKNIGNIVNPVYKKQIEQFLNTLLVKTKEDFSSTGKWSQQVVDSLLPFITGGKMIRGCLVLFIYHAYGKKISKDAIRIAVAVELFHTGLLIHDDIMDNDLVRRGQPTIFAQYQLLGEVEKITDSYHFGQSMGMCVGDIIFFLGFQVLSEISDSDMKQYLMKLYTKELMNVGFAQMQDVYAGYTSKDFLPQQIENLYKNKTGRYTFSLPMMLGTLFAKQKQIEIKKVEILGEKMGILYQLIDDQLNLFGNETETGKPVGSDVRENKKTVYRAYLYRIASENQRKKLRSIFGNSQVTSVDLVYVKDLMLSLGVQEIIERRINKFVADSEKIIRKLSVSQENKKTMLQLLSYLKERKQ